MADALYTCAACGGDCGTGDCVEFVTEDCVDGVELCESEICAMLYSCADPNDSTIPLSKPGNWEVTADWTAAIGNGVFKVNVIGDMPEPTQETLTISKRRKKIGKKAFVLNLDIDEWTPVNYEAMRKWECGATVFMWVQTLDGALYGGENGIRVDITKANSPLLRGENQYKKILLQAEWDSKCHPPVTDAVDPL